MTDSTLLAHPEPAPRRNVHHHKTPCPWADPLPTDTYAPPPCKCKCKSSNGYMRREHEYLIETRRGVCCVWCGRRNGMEHL